MNREIPFLERFRDALLEGRKTATSRYQRLAEPGDRFQAFGAVFRVTAVQKETVAHVAEWLWLREGVDSREEFLEIWRQLHPRRPEPLEDEVWVHDFLLETPPTPEALL